MATARHAAHAEGATRSFDGRAVLDGLRLHVRYGEFVALLGRDGCRRSARLRVLTGLELDIAGTVLVPRRKAVVLQAQRSTPWKWVRRATPCSGGLCSSPRRTSRQLLQRLVTTAAGPLGRSGTPSPLVEA
jgi:sulfonate transport system ATP-binding protein